ncbi:response regulator [Yersinia massiliensis]|uniref:response regulator n=1 Tax=Yersinia massiliensis TaxID=419257 RepID=UPI000C14F143|nr:response regulator [Yersinia massiliensis]PHZ21681.1 hypothetical protein CS535_21235 [Yersinia massiliensis]
MNNTLTLVFDETPLTRGAVSQLVKDKGGNVMETGCTLEFVKLTNMYKPEFIILDINIFEYGGLTFVKKIRRISPE